MDMDDDMNMDMGMSMSFSFTCNVGPLLFSWWTINSCTSLWLSFIPVVVLGIARHWAFSYVAGVKRSAKGNAATCSSSQSRTTALLEGSTFRSDGSPAKVESANLGTRFIWTLISTLGGALSLLSMLVVMTYNSGLFIAVLVGEAIGHWVFGNHSLPDTMRACH
ncbi:unnamed protein product [Sphacelaria rigidula]